jgi:hypothetical protein
MPSSSIVRLLALLCGCAPIVPALPVTYFYSVATVSSAGRSSYIGIGDGVLPDLTIVTAMEARSLSVSGGKLFWLEGSELKSGNLDGTQQTTVASFAAVPTDIYVDADAGFYYAGFGGAFSGSGAFSHAIYRSSLTGSLSGPPTVTTGADPHSLSFGGGKLYWLEGNSIWFANPDGTGKTRLMAFDILPIDMSLDAAGGYAYISFDGLNEPDPHTFACRTPGGSPFSPCTPTISGMKPEIYRLPLVLPLDPSVVPGETFLINPGGSAVSIMKSGDAVYYMTRKVDHDLISNESLDHQSRGEVHLPAGRLVVDFTVYSDPTAATPEPSTLVVSAMGLGLLLAACKIRRDRHPTA